MNNHIKNTILGAVLTFTTTAAWGISPSVAKAQEAYLAKDPQAVMTHIGQALRGPKLSPAESRNIFGLYHRTLTENRGQGDLGWTVPSQILRLKTAVEYFDDDKDKVFRLVISASMKQGTELKSFTLRKYPDLMVVDMENQIGRFDQGLDGENSFFRARPRGQPLPIASGAYLLDFSLTTGEKVSGWFFITDDMNSTAAPEFIGVEPGQVYNTGTPLLSWKNFVSPQHQPNDRSELVVAVSPLADNGDWGSPHWILWENNSPRTSVDLAKDKPSETAQIPLANGNYKVQVTYNDIKNIAPLRMTRASKVARKITIQK